MEKPKHLLGLFSGCAGKDSNLRRPKSRDLQSLAIDHSATDAIRPSIPVSTLSFQLTADQNGGLSASAQKGQFPAEMFGRKDGVDRIDPFVIKRDPFPFDETTRF